MEFIEFLESYSGALTVIVTVVYVMKIYQDIRMNKILYLNLEMLKEPMDW